MTFREYLSSIQRKQGTHGTQHWLLNIQYQIVHTDSGGEQMRSTIYKYCKEMKGEGDNVIWLPPKKYGRKALAFCSGYSFFAIYKRGF